MSKTVLPPSHDDEVAKLKRRVSDLEAILQKFFGQYGPEVLYSKDGNLADGMVSERYYPAFDVRLVAIIASVVDAPGAAGVILHGKKNGTTFATVTIPDGQNTSDIATVSVLFTANVDRLEWEIDTAGGAAGLDVQCRFHIVKAQ